MAPRSDLLYALRTVPFARDLAVHGGRPAIITPQGELSYRDLAVRVDAMARRLGRERRLVLLAAANTVDCVVVYLAALAAGHPLLMVPGDRPESVRSLVDAYDPDVVARATGRRCRLDERRPVSAHTLHPDLALLLSTSGSTGSPKLVRLSHENLHANADAIAGYLAIRVGDRAATTLPMHYCYGLSVINSHLLRGAGLILTGLSVAGPHFWELFRQRRGTTFAGVPYTFDLLDRVGFATMRLPHLRYVTQAGGRLAPDRVRRYAELGRRNGWDLFVMYGQTEATARMAYLPPDLAHSRPEAIGVPVPGGSFRIEPLPEWPDPGTGELVYAGPNVMLGYAEGPSDLRLGRTVAHLCTGDVARRADDGLYELVGRRSGFAKVLGLRIDPHRVEALLERHGLTSCCAGGTGELVVAVESGGVAEGGGDELRIRRLVAQECGLQASAVRVHLLAELPRLATGKPDYQVVRELARTAGAGVPGQAPPAASSPLPPPAQPPLPPPAQPPQPAPQAGPADLCRLYAEVLGRSEVTEESSFVSLGGDSLSYVEMSLRLERALGHLPPRWHDLPIRDLRPPEQDRPRRIRELETSVALRAVSIVLIVGSHIPLFTIKGGAHLLLGVAGFNFARFHLTAAGRGERTRHIAGSVARVALPSMAWIGLMLVITDDYRLTNLALLHGVLGPPNGRTEWHFWFVETLVYILLALAAVLAVPLLDRAERRVPFGFPLALVALGLVTRYDLPGIRDSRPPSAVIVFWLFALGWAAARATTAWQRALVTVAAVATVPGAFDEPRREALIIAGLALLTWVRSVPSVAAVNRVAAVLAASSLYIYLTHWQVYPRLDDVSPLLALVASLAAGIGYAAAVKRAGKSRWLACARMRVFEGRPISQGRRVNPERRAGESRHRTG
ncbi:MAG TPA: non-ribosomal peptide synthetase [Micromonosporaceae bacterium]|nr:non-ribosomal peptide synthetase [Micromonosporaceae bacterium]